MVPFSRVNCKESRFQQLLGNKYPAHGIMQHSVTPVFVFPMMQSSYESLVEWTVTRPWQESFDLVVNSSVLPDLLFLPQLRLIFFF